MGGRDHERRWWRGGRGLEEISDERGEMCLVLKELYLISNSTDMALH
jgi:hypothetical protein